ncbi:hypothetical protein N7494_004423 [Penicillium frequentans]|uniref:Aminoglycoside phosphotransferase domain-containing protein n=1 Tax=Penicillium frequentans TaxID=3151616 RepID=A0AAD6GIX0_9EURO|nr:hypothetical protein N7494_004423 [Penicillium glabrum]
MADERSKGCVACGWAREQEEQCSYSSHVKLFYGVSRRGTWSIGSDVIMKEHLNEGPKTEVDTLTYLAKPPISQFRRLYVTGWTATGDTLSIQERIPVQTLEQTWPSSSESQRIAVADQVVGFRNQLRSITWASMGIVDQGPSNPGLTFFDNEPHGSFHSDLELWEALSLTLHDPPRKTFPQEPLEYLKKEMSSCEPYVLTHCVFNLGKIIVNEDLTGLLGWECSAYSTIWHEYVSASWRRTEAEWISLLQRRLEFHGDGSNLLC